MENKKNAKKWKHEEGGGIHKPFGHRSISDNGWILTKQLKKNMGLFKRKNKEVQTAPQINLPGIKLPTLQYDDAAARAKLDKLNMDSLETAQNKTMRYQIRATKDVSLEDMATRLGIDSNQLLEWNQGADQGFKQGDIINLNLTNDQGRALMKSVDELRAENERRTAERQKYANRDDVKQYGFIRDLTGKQVMNTFRTQKDFDNEEARVKHNTAIESDIIANDQRQAVRNRKDWGPMQFDDGTSELTSKQFVGDIQDAMNTAGEYGLKFAGAVGGAMALPVIASATGLDSVITYGINNPVSQWAGRTLLNSGKYMIQHPIESFIMPQVYQEGTNAGFDVYEKATGNKVSDNTKRITGTAVNFIANPTISNITRGIVGKYVQGAETAATTAAQKYLYGLVSNGQNGSAYVGSSIVNGLHNLTQGAIGTGISEAKYSALNGQTTSEVLENYGWNPYIAKGTEFITDGLLYSLSGQLAHRPYSKLANNANQLAGGAASPENAVSNIGRSKSSLLTVNRPAIDSQGNSYQLGYNESIAMAKTNQHRGNASKVAKGSELEGNEIYFNTYAGNNVQVGQNIGRGNVIVAKVRKGATAGTDNFMINSASHIINGAGRWGNGSQAIIVENQGSLKLPGIKQMQKEGYTGLIKNENGEFIEVPIDKSFKPSLTGAREDWVTTNADGSASVLNVNGHNVTYIRTPEGKVLEAGFDVNGTGSAAGNGFISGIADAGQYPMLTYRVREAPEQAFVRKASQTGPKINKWEMLKLAFSPKARKAYKQQQKEFRQSDEGKAQAKQQRQDAANMRNQQQKMIDILRHSIGGKIGINQIGI